MSLDVHLERKRWVSYDKATWTEEREDIYWANITHNLGEMADKAGIYEALWRPYKLMEGYVETERYEDELILENDLEVHAKDIIPFLEKGLHRLKMNPEYFKQFNSPNGWGMYENFIPFVEKYLEACKANPEAKVTVSR